MPSTAYNPQTDHRDIGLGVAFFRHPYRSSQDHKIYHDYTHLPILGYCPGCSSKAHMNLSSAESGTTTLDPDFSTAVTSTSKSLDVANSDLPNYPEDGVLVTAETHHSGPSYTYDKQIIDTREDYRCKMVKVMLDKWANIDKMKKQREANEKKAAERRERQERAAHEARMRWNREMQQQEQMMDSAYARGVVKSPKQEATMAIEGSKNTDKLSADEAMAILKERKVNQVPSSLVGKVSQHKQTRQPAISKPNKRGPGLGLSGYEDPELGRGTGSGLVAYDDSEGEDGDPIVID